MHGEYAVAGEKDSAVIAAQMRLVIGAVTVVGIAGITDGDERAPAVAFFENDKQMIFLVVGQAAGADENKEGAVGRNFGIDILLGAVAERKRLRQLVGAVGVAGRVEAFVTLFVDGGEIEGAVGRDAGLPERLAGEVDGVRQALRLAPAGAHAVDAPDIGDAVRRFGRVRRLG